MPKNKKEAIDQQPSHWRRNGLAYISLGVIATSLLAMGIKFGGILNEPQTTVGPAGTQVAVETQVPNPTAIPIQKTVVAVAGTLIPTAVPDPTATPTPQPIQIDNNAIFAAMNTSTLTNERLIQGGIFTGSAVVVYDRGQNTWSDQAKWICGGNEGCIQKLDEIGTNYVSRKGLGQIAVCMEVTDRKLTLVKRPDANVQDLVVDTEGKIVDCNRKNPVNTVEGASEGFGTHVGALEMFLDPSQKNIEPGLAGLLNSAFSYSIYDTGCEYNIYGNRGLFDALWEFNKGEYTGVLTVVRDAQNAQWDQVNALPGYEVTSPRLGEIIVNKPTIIATETRCEETKEWLDGFAASSDRQYHEFTPTGVGLP